MIKDYCVKVGILVKNGYSFHSSTYILTSIIALAFFLRAYRLEDIPAGLYWDEISAVYSPFLYQHGLTDASLRVIISHLLSGTYFLFPLSGSSIFLTRLPELISGTLLVFTTYLLAKEMFSVRIGLISALLISVLPWAIHFSRFQAFSSAYVLFFTVTLLLLYKGINSDVERKKIVYYGSGSFMLGLTAMIYSSSQAFVPLFLAIFLVIYVRKKDVNLSSIFSKRTIFVIIIFVLTVSPIFTEYFVHSQNSSLGISYSTYSHSKGILDWFNMIIQRSRIHLSPTFLVFTIPSTHDLPFEQMIAKSGQLRYSPTIYGELNFYGLLVYPGILLLIIQALFHRSKTHMVIFGWILCYSIAAGVAYYDNPNAARNIVGMPALAITIAMFMEFLVKFVYSSRTIIGCAFKRVIIIALIASVALPTGLYLYSYYTSYYAQSATVFDYGYKEVADFLTAKKLWQKDIFMNVDFAKNLSLSFYSPTQPPIRPLTDFPDLQVKKMTVALNNRNFTFNHGWIRYDTKIDNGYGGALSSHMNMVSPNGRDSFSLSLYHNDSNYAPNDYLLSQVVNGTSYFRQLPLDKTVEYDKWYRVSLFFNSTNILFYLDGKLLNNWNRPSDSIYSIIKLGAESTDVSFKNMTIQQTGHTNDIFTSNNDFQTESKYIPVKINMEEDSSGEKVLHLWSSINDGLLVTSHQEDAKILNNYGIPSSILNQVYYPNGTIALSLFELDRIQPTITPHPSIVAQATSSTGANISYNLTASDNMDGSVPVDCVPGTGTKFSFGTSDIKCTAIDSHGNKKEESFTVRVYSAMDTTSPVLTLPEDIVTRATSLSGAIVHYNVTANDNNEGFISSNCLPASGTTFSLGTTTVVCTATDSHDNKAEDSFTVTVTF